MPSSQNNIRTIVTLMNDMMDSFFAAKSKISNLSGSLENLDEVIETLKKSSAELKRPLAQFAQDFQTALKSGKWTAVCAELERFDHVLKKVTNGRVGVKQFWEAVSQGKGLFTDLGDEAKYFSDIVDRMNGYLGKSGDKLQNLANLIGKFRLGGRAFTGMDTREIATFLDKVWNVKRGGIADNIDKLAAAGKQPSVAARGASAAAAGASGAAAGASGAAAGAAGASGAAANAAGGILIAIEIAKMLAQFILQFVDMWLSLQQIAAEAMKRTFSKFIELYRQVTELGVKLFGEVADAIASVATQILSGASELASQVITDVANTFFVVMEGIETIAIDGLKMASETVAKLHETMKAWLLESIVGLKEILSLFGQLIPEIQIMLDVVAKAMDSVSGVAESIIELSSAIITSVFERITESLNELFKQIRAGLEALMSSITTSLKTIISSISEILKHGVSFLKSFSENVVTTVTKLAEIAGNQFIELWKLGKERTAAWWHFWLGWLNEGLGGFFKSGIDLLKNTTERTLVAMEAAFERLSAVLTMFGNILSSALTVLSGLLQGVLSLVMEVGKSILSLLGTILKSAAQLVVTLVKSAITFVWSLLKAFGEAAWNLFKSLGLSIKSFVQIAGEVLKLVFMQVKDFATAWQTIFLNLNALNREVAVQGVMLDDMVNLSMKLGLSFEKIGEHYIVVANAGYRTRQDLEQTTRVVAMLERGLGIAADLAAGLAFQFDRVFNLGQDFLPRMADYWTAVQMNTALSAKEAANLTKEMMDFINRIPARFKETFIRGLGMAGAMMKELGLSTESLRKHLEAMMKPISTEGMVEKMLVRLGSTLAEFNKIRNTLDPFLSQLGKLKGIRQLFIPANLDQMSAEMRTMYQQMAQTMAGISAEEFEAAARLTPQREAQLRQMSAVAQEFKDVNKGFTDAMSSVVSLWEIAKANFQGLWSLVARPILEGLRPLFGKLIAGIQSLRPVVDLMVKNLIQPLSNLFGETLDKHANTFIKWVVDAGVKLTHFLSPFIKLLSEGKWREFFQLVWANLKAIFLGLLNYVLNIGDAIVRNLWGFLTDVGIYLINVIPNNFKAIFVFIRDLILNLLSPAITSIWHLSVKTWRFVVLPTMLSAAREFWMLFNRVGGHVWQLLWDYFKDMWHGVVWPAMQSIGNYLMEVMANLSEALGELFNALRKELSELMTQVGQSLTVFGIGPGKSLIDAAKKLLNAKSNIDWGGMAARFTQAMEAPTEKLSKEMNALWENAKSRSRELWAAFQHGGFVGIESLRKFWHNENPLIFLVRGKFKSWNAFLNAAQTAARQGTFKDFKASIQQMLDEQKRLHPVFFARPENAKRIADLVNQLNSLEMVFHEKGVVGVLTEETKKALNAIGNDIGKFIRGEAELSDAWYDEVVMLRNKLPKSDNVPFFELMELMKKPFKDQKEILTKLLDTEGVAQPEREEIFKIFDRMRANWWSGLEAESDNFMSEIKTRYAEVLPELERQFGVAKDELLRIIQVIGEQGENRLKNLGEEIAQIIMPDPAKLRELMTGLFKDVQTKYQAAVAAGKGDEFFNSKDWKKLWRQIAVRLNLPDEERNKLMEQFKVLLPQGEAIFGEFFETIMQSARSLKDWTGSVEAAAEAERLRAKAMGLSTTEWRQKLKASLQEIANKLNIVIDENLSVNAPALMSPIKRLLPSGVFQREAARVAAAQALVDKRQKEFEEAQKAGKLTNEIRKSLENAQQALKAAQDALEERKDIETHGGLTKEQRQQWKDWEANKVTLQQKVVDWKEAEKEYLTQLSADIRIDAEKLLNNVWQGAIITANSAIAKVFPKLFELQQKLLNTHTAAVEAQKQFQNLQKAMDKLTPAQKSRYLQWKAMEERKIKWGIPESGILGGVRGYDWTRGGGATLESQSERTKGLKIPQVSDGLSKFAVTFEGGQKSLLGEAQKQTKLLIAIKNQGGILPETSLS